MKDLSHSIAVNYYSLLGRLFENLENDSEIKGNRDRGNPGPTKGSGTNSTGSLRE
jgi:hypothetical protein